MSQFGLYSSLGRIDKVVLFDTTSHQLNQGPDISQRLHPVVENNIEIITGFRVFHRYAVFYLFYMVNVPENSPGPYFMSSINCWFIPVNDRIRNLYIPTKWVQDPFIIAPGNILLYDSNYISHPLAALMNDRLEMNGYKPLDFINREIQEHTASEEIKGGDILVGKCSLGNFVLHSISGLDDNTKKKIIRQFGIKNENNYLLQYVGNQLTENMPLYYHLDFFITLVGPVPVTSDCQWAKNNSTKQLVLVAKPYEVNPRSIDAVADYDPPRPQAIYNNNGETIVGFETIYLPFIILKKKPERPISRENVRFVLSYNNCLVENYDPLVWNGNKGDTLKTGKECRRTINVYFPDFRNTLWNYIQESFGDDIRNIEIRALINQKIEIDKDGNITLDSNTIVDFEKWENTQTAFNELKRFLNDMHSKIRESLALKGIYNVHFIRHNFFELAESWGSLHCMVKVVSREGVIC